MTNFTQFRLIEVSDIEPYREQLLRSWKRNLSPDYSDARIEWFYRSNPSGNGHTCLAVSEDKGEVIGFGSLYPWTFYCQGAPMRMAVAIDFGVDKVYRVFGPALMIQKKLLLSIINNGFDGVFVYPDKTSSGVFKRAGYIHVGVSKEWTYILKSKNIINNIYKNYLKYLAPIIDLLILMHHWLSYRLNYRSYNFVILDKCSKDFDELWDKEKFNYDLIQEKTSEYYNWRYLSNTSIKYHYYCLYDQKNKLQGYVLFSKKDEEVNIKDIFPANCVYVRPLLWHFISAMKKEGVNSLRLSFFGNDMFIRTIKKIGFIERKTTRDYLFYFRSEVAEKYLSLLKDRSSVFLFFG